jgi:hypothetical protein
LVQRAIGTGDTCARITDDIGQGQHARTTNAAEEIGFVFVHQWRLWPEDDFGNGPIYTKLRHPREGGGPTPALSKHHSPALDSRLRGNDEF